MKITENWNLFGCRLVWTTGCVLIGSTASALAASYGAFDYQVIGDSVEITDYRDGEVGEVDIPAEIDGKPVTSIGDDAFSDCGGLVGISIPGGVTSIGSLAFYACWNLTSITLPESVTHIGDGAFDECRNLASIHAQIGNPQFLSVDGVLYSSDQSTLVRWPEAKRDPFVPSPALTTVGDGAFYASWALTRIDIPAGVTHIGERAFSFCSYLEAINLPESVTSIGGGAFSGCFELTGITIPDGVTSISHGTFSGCFELAELGIPKGVTSIGSYAFSSCSSLTKITLPASITSIGDGAFLGCTELAKAVFLGDAPTLGQELVLTGVNPSFKVYYLSSKSGFPSATWAGHPAMRIDEAAYPAASWLLTHGYNYDTSLDQDPDGDGVNLLTAFALNLDPDDNPYAGMPMPVLDQNSLSFTFHAASLGINYIVQTSTDLRNWTTEGVSLSELNLEGQRTATVNLDSPRQLLRLVIEED